VSGAKMPATWRNVVFGPHNAGPTEQLFAELAINPDIYYHRRKYDRYRHNVGWSLNKMSKYTGEAAEVPKINKADKYPDGDNPDKDR
jgi:cytochrome c1